VSKTHWAPHVDASCFWGVLSSALRRRHSSARRLVWATRRSGGASSLKSVEWPSCHPRTHAGRHIDRPALPHSSTRASGNQVPPDLGEGVGARGPRRKTMICTHTHTRTHPFNGPLSGTTRVGRYQKGKTNLDFTESRDSEWQWHHLSHMQVCTSLQTDNHASTPPLSFLQAGCPSCRPTNSVKALKAIVYMICNGVTNA